MISITILRTHLVAAREKLKKQNEAALGDFRIDRFISIEETLRDIDDLQKAIGCLLTFRYEKKDDVDVGS